MKLRHCFVGTVLIFLLCKAYAQTSKGSRHLTPQEIQTITNAVQDEIYDYGYFKSFYQIGQNVGTPENWSSRLRIFINPMYDLAGEHGEIIYKLMPFGQVYRLFFLDPEKGVQLDGDPQGKFPITQPSHLTVYMDEDDVCHDEQTWTRSSFTIDTKPSAAIVKAASKRQKARTGFSYAEHENRTHKE